MRVIRRCIHAVINSFVYGVVRTAMRLFYKIFKIWKENYMTEIDKKLIEIDVNEICGYKVLLETQIKVCNNTINNYDYEFINHKTNYTLDELKYFVNKLQEALYELNNADVEQECEILKKMYTYQANYRIRIDSDIKVKFENAEIKGMKNSEDYMYMYSRGEYDFFKHCDTRNYEVYVNEEFEVI